MVDEQTPPEHPDDTVIADAESTRIVRRRTRVAPPPDAPQPPPPEAQGGGTETPRPEPVQNLLQRHLGPPPPARPLERAPRHGLPSLARRERRFGLAALIALGLTTLASGVGLWFVWYLW